MCVISAILVISLPNALGKIRPLNPNVYLILATELSCKVQTHFTSTFSKIMLINFIS